jgi:hypothetical protein
MTRRPVNTGEIQRAAVKTARKQRAVAKKEPTLPAPDDLDIAAIAQAKARNEARPRRVKLNAKMSDTDQATVKRMELSAPHSDHGGWYATLTDALGSRSQDFTTRTLSAVMDIADPQGESAGRAYNAVLAQFGAIGPKDEYEAIVAGHIIATQSLAMDCMNRAAKADTIPKREAYINQATKCSRTFLAGVEALGKLRTGGKQQVEVRYIYVDARTQTVINPLGGGSEGQTIGQPYGPAGIARLPFAQGVPMLSDDAARDLLPAPSLEGEAQMRPPRQRQPRRATRGTQR